MTRDEENSLRTAAVKIYSEIEALKNLESYLCSMLSFLSIMKSKKERDYREALQKLVFDRRLK